MAEGTLQTIYDTCVYAMLAHGTAPTERKFNIHRTRAMNHLLKDLQHVADYTPPEQMGDELARVAGLYGLEPRV